MCFIFNWIFCCGDGFYGEFFFDGVICRWVVYEVFYWELIYWKCVFIWRRVCEW